MNGDGDGPVGAVDAQLGDRQVRVRVVDVDGGDELQSVGLPDKVDLRDAMDTIGDAAKLVHDKLEHLTRRGRRSSSGSASRCRAASSSRCCSTARPTRR